MAKENKLSNKQIKALVVSTTVGIGILSLPNRLAIANGNDGWIPLILSGLLIIPIIMAMDKIFQMYPDQDFFSIGREVLGKWLFNIFLVIFFIYLLILMSNIVRNLGELVKAFLLVTTPIEVLIISFILVTSYMARDNIQVIGRAAHFIYPLILGFIIFLIVVTLPDIDFTNMLPVFQSDFSNIPKGMDIAFFSYIGYEVLLFAFPYAEKKENTLRSSLKGLGVVILVYTIIYVLTMAQFGVYSLRRQSFPTLSIVREVDLPGYFVENLDGVVMAIWVLVIFTTMAPFYFASGKVLSNLFNTKDHSLFILPIAPIIYIMSLIPRNLVHLNETLGKYTNYLGLVTIVLMPIIIYFVALFKTRRQSK
ncbi:MAG: endospore germination permease [Tissierellia bacterium]|nr:endospore germination permease [Tissierellia bacterium]